MKYQYEVIFCIVNAGFTDVVMDAAKEYGATGGTVIHARGTANKEAEKLFSIAIQPEKEIVMILVPAEIKDASTVPAGQPSVFMNGSIVESHIMSKPVSLVGASLSVNDDYSVHVVVNKATADAGQWTVKYDVSYSVEDFPVCVALTRNLCTCRDEVCYGMEPCNMYLCTGEAIQPAPECLIKYLDMPDTPFTVGDDTYLMFYIDMSDPYAPFKATGRINSVRVDFEDIDTQTPDKNAFDVCWIAFFRNVDEAEEYVMEYLGITETDKNPAKETEGKTPTDTEPPAGVDATEGKQNENPVESESIPAGEKQTESKTDAPSRGGCGSVIGFGTITVIALASAMGTVSFRKKKD